MQYSAAKISQANSLRKRGYSLQEISQQLKISKSTASLWLRNIKLNNKAKQRLEYRKILGRKNARKTRAIKFNKKEKEYRFWAKKVLSHLSITPSLARLLCAVLYWAEGGKFTDNRLEFTNSDPKMIRTFLRLLRLGFEVNEIKLRTNMHLHEYHNEFLQKKFWHKITAIPYDQFTRSYLKPHTSKIIRKNYPGCVRICYYSSDTARKIKALYLALAKQT